MAALARQQYGVVTRGQLLGLGMSAEAIKERRRRGLLRAVHRGIYALGGAPLVPNGRRLAAVLACGPGTVLSHRSAGHFWGVFPYDPGRVEVSRDASGWTKRGAILRRQARLLGDEVEEVDGIPVTCVSRMILDLAAVVSEREVERAFHEAEVKRLTSRVSLPQLIERHPGRRGVGTVRSILARRAPAGITENDFEEEFVAFLDAHGLPRPLFNATLPLRGRLLRPDCMWPQQRLLVELDGRASHGTEQAFESDRQRDRALLAEGWRSTRVTWRQLRDEPVAIAADLRAQLAAGDRPAA
jgi:very-short-patch-repair endonuclease